MMKMAFSTIAIFLLVATTIAVAQGNSGESSSSSNGPAAKLRADLIKAAQNGHLTDSQKDSMKNAAAALHKAAQAKQSGEKIDRDEVKKAMSDIKSIINSDAFQPEDKAAVQADLEALKEKAKEARGRRGRGPLRQLFGAGR